MILREDPVRSLYICIYIYTYYTDGILVSHLDGYTSASLEGSAHCSNWVSSRKSPTKKCLYPKKRGEPTMNYG